MKRGRSKIILVAMLMLGIAYWFYLKTDTLLFLRDNNKTESKTSQYVNPGPVLQVGTQLLSTVTVPADSIKIPQPVEGTNIDFQKSSSNGAYVVLNSSMEANPRERKQSLYIYSGTGVLLSSIPIDVTDRDIIHIEVTPSGRYVSLTFQQVSGKKIFKLIDVIEVASRNRVFSELFDLSSVVLYGNNFSSDNSFELAVSIRSPAASAIDCYRIKLDALTSTSLCTIRSNDFSAILPGDVKDFCINKIVFLTGGTRIFSEITKCDGSDWTSYYCTYDYKSKESLRFSPGTNYILISPFSSKFLMAEIPNKPNETFEPKFLLNPGETPVNISPEMLNHSLKFFDEIQKEIYFIAPDSKTSIAVDLMRINQSKRNVFKLKL